MALSYTDALQIMQSEASRLRSSAFDTVEDFVPLSQSLNRISKRKYACSESTPKFDTSAMDGYALNSEVTQTASAEAPVTFCVRGTMAAGDKPIELSQDPEEDGTYPCVEIMTGARFPNSLSKGRDFDCCVRLEDTKEIVSSSSGPRCRYRYIQITKPVKYNQNRRIVGCDFKKNDVIVHSGEKIRPQQIMALASVGVEEVSVVRKPRIGIFSTGSELCPSDTSKENHPDESAHRIPDINGPYFTTTLRDLNHYEVDFLGVIDDSSSAVCQTVSRHLDARHYDLIISTGAVSAGKFDFVREGTEKKIVGSQILFHRIAIRPGHLALFATVPSYRDPAPAVDLDGAAPRSLSHGRSSRRTAFFGLPGNPVASAACLRFLVLPFLRGLLSLPAEKAMKAVIRGEGSNNGNGNGILCTKNEKRIIATFPPETDVFRTGIFLPGYRHNDINNNHAETIHNVQLVTDHSPGKISPFLQFGLRFEFLTKL
ncbi:hypothetical protein VTN00DRAFT_8395 [Thermoascus crustaceus]|uniref:uncharacterized protein n=1 Tax=Thermoascus crustaceus TaxID=5088 RepID=UPI0037437707